MEQKHQLAQWSRGIVVDLQAYNKVLNSNPIQVTQFFSV